MERQERTHAANTRAAHWINALLVAALLWTGFAMFARDREFAAIVHVVPAWLWSAVHFSGGKRQLFAWHTYAGAAFAVVGALYVASLIVGGGWKRIVPRGTQWSHDPERPLAYSIPQRVAYSGVFFGAGAMVLSGVSLWFKHQIPWLLALLGGERFVLPAHVILATALIGFIGVHVSQVLLAGATTLRSMIPVGAKAPAAQSVGLMVRR